MSGVRLSRHYFPQMLASGWGRVVFIASESGVMTPAEMIHYGVTKSSQLALSRGMAELTKGTQVTVNTVMPGPTQSEGIVDFLRKAAPGAKNAAEAEAEFFRVHRSSSLLQRLIDPKEIAPWWPTRQPARPRPTPRCGSRAASCGRSSERIPTLSIAGRARRSCRPRRLLPGGVEIRLAAPGPAPRYPR